MLSGRLLGIGSDSEYRTRHSAQNSRVAALPDDHERGIHSKWALLLNTVLGQTLLSDCDRCYRARLQTSEPIPPVSGSVRLVPCPYANLFRNLYRGPWREHHLGLIPFHGPGNRWKPSDWQRCPDIQHAISVCILETTLCPASPSDSPKRTRVTWQPWGSHSGLHSPPQAPAAPE